MIAHRLVTYNIARKLYKLGYEGNTEYSIPVTKQGTLYKNGPSIPYIHIDTDEDKEGLISRAICTGTNYNDNRLACPTCWEVQEWLIKKHNIFIAIYSYNSKGNYRNCKWIVDINKKPLTHSNRDLIFYDSRTEALTKGVELVVNRLYSEKQ